MAGTTLFASLFTDLVSESGDLGNLSILPPSVVLTGGWGPFRAERPFNRATGVLGASLECSDAAQTAFW